MNDHDHDMTEKLWTEPSGERTIDLGDTPLRLDLRNPSGSLEVVASERSDLRVAWTKTGDPTSPFWERTGLKLGQTDGLIAIAPDISRETPASEHGSVLSSVWGAFAALATSVSLNVAFDIRIEVPIDRAESSVTAQTASGRLRLVDLASGTIVAETASGAIEMARCGGDLKADTASGRIVVDEAAGRCALHSASGAIVVQASVPLDLVAETASGGIRLRLAGQAGGKVKVTTVSGSITVEAPPEISVAASTRSVSGRVSAEPPFIVGKPGEWQGAAPPAVVLRAKTVSGAIRLKQGAATQPPVPAEPPASHSPAPEPPDPVETLPGAAATPGNRPKEEILRAVERGEIDVDEALGLLDRGEEESAPST